MAQQRGQVIGIYAALAIARASVFAGKRPRLQIGSSFIKLYNSQVAWRKFDFESLHTHTHTSAHTKYAKSVNRLKRLSDNQILVEKEDGFIFVDSGAMYS